MRRSIAVFSALVVLSLAVPAGRAWAQTRADSAAVLLDAARRFESEGRTEVSEALRDMILVRFGDTAAAAEVRRLLALGDAGRAERSGNVELQVWSTLYGLWLGVAIPAMAGADGPEAYGAGLLLGGPAGFFASRAYARSRTLTEGQARAITWGGTWGTWQGLGWANVLNLGGERVEVCPDGLPCYEEETGSRTEETLGAMIAGGLAGIAVGALLSQKPISPGLATTVNFGSLWGTWFGFATSFLADIEGDGLLAGTLIGGNVGLVATALLGPDWQLSRNRARLISIAGVAGGLGGAGLGLILQPEDGKVFVALPLAGSVAGLVIGTMTTRDYDAPTALAGYVSAASAVGGAREGRSSPTADYGMGSALVRLDDGGWSVGLPLPVPTMVVDGRPTESGRVRAAVRPALSIQLLDARF